MLRIAHVTDCYLPRLGGIELQVHDLAARQRAAGHDVAVVTATPRARHDRAQFDRIDGVPVHRLTVDLPFELPVHPRAASAMRALLQQSGYDVVHVHAGVVSPFAFAVAPEVVRSGTAMVVTVHSLWGYLTPVFRLLDRPVGWSRWPAVLSAVSEVAAGPLQRIVGPDVEVRVLPNGIDPTAWQVDPLPRDPGDVLIVAVMRLAQRKRPHALLRMLRRARAQLPSHVRVRALVIGEGPERRALQRYLDRHAMDWVRLTGRYTREQIREVYRRADLFIAPANLESFGIAALEARTAGLPVLAMANSGIREFVTNGVEGLLAASDTDLADGLVRLARSPELRGRIAVNNRARPPRFGWDEVLTRTELAYKAAAGLLGRQSKR